MNNEPWIIQSPLDMHLHLRQGEMLKAIAPCSTCDFSGAVIMPNLVPPIDSLDKVRHYRETILHAVGRPTFTPLMTLFFRKYSREELVAAKPHIIGIKLYPEGVTTNSDSGVRDIFGFHGMFAMMEELEIPLLVHGETSGFVLDRENEFLITYAELATRFPRLMIVMEHITTREAVALLDRHENLHATVTVHHLLMTLDDMAGGMLNPHLFCKPILKRPEDRDALQQAVLSAHPRIMFGSDSAPHPISTKECCGCAAGVFSAPVALPLLAEFFDARGARALLQGFVSDHARTAYRVTPPPKAVALVKKEWIVPDTIGGVKPLMAGRTLAWSVTQTN